MAQITSANLGNGAGTYNSDIVAKDIDMFVSNYVKDSTPVTNMAMSKKRKVSSTLHIWPVDTYRQPTLNAKKEGQSVDVVNDPASNTRANLGNYSQIFTTVVGATGTARAIEQAGGDPQAYQEVKQLAEIMFDVELQLVRADAASTKYSGQASAQTAPNNGRRLGSIFSFAGTVSNPVVTGGATPSNGLFLAANDGSDPSAVITATNTPFNGVLANAGLGYWGVSTGGTATTQQFSPFLYKQLVTVAEQRFNAKLTDVICPTSMRTHLSDTFPTSRSINRVDSSRGDSISTYEGDFNYTYEIKDCWVMDQTGSDNTTVIFLNPEVIQWGSLRELGPNNEVYSNADASIDQYIMEGTLIVRNPAGVALLRGISPTGANVTAPRASTLVNRYIA